MSKLPQNLTTKELALYFEAPYFVWDGKSEAIGYRGTYTNFPNNMLIAQEVIDLKPRGKILELGSARGFITKILNDKGYDATGIDISRYCYKTRVTDKIVLGNITELPFKDNEFDIAFSIETLEHIPEKEIDNVLSETSRVAKRGLHAIAYINLGLGNAEDDLTHVNLKTLEWWKDKLKHFSGDFRAVDKAKEGRWPEIVGLKSMLPPPEPKTGKIGINCGCYVDMFANSEEVKWINLDILDLNNYARAYGYNFIPHDIRTRLPFEDDSISYIFASHLIEHLSIEEGIEFLKECYRILKPNGIIRLSAPDLLILSKKYLGGKMNEFDDLNPEYKNYGTQATKFWQLAWSGHQAGYDYSALKEVLLKAGFDEKPIKKMSAFQSQDKTLQHDTWDSYPDHSLFVEAKKEKEKGKKKIKGKGSMSGVSSKEDKQRIALISTPIFTVPPTGYSGLEQIVWNLANALDALGHYVTIVAPEGSKAAKHGDLITTGPQQTEVHVDWLQKEREAFEYYKDLITHKDFDIVHSHEWLGFSYILKVNDPEIKLIHTHHGAYNWNSPPPVGKPNLIAISKWMQTYTKMYFKQLGYEVDCKYCYNGIAIEDYPFKKEKGDRLLFVGRLDAFKRPLVAIDVAKKLNMGLDIVGGSFVDDVNYMNQVKRACDGKQIKLHLDAAHEKKVELYQNAKCTLFVGKMGEPFGLIVPESNATGTPVIATPDGAIPEVLADGETGFLCNTIDEMCEAVKRIGEIKPEDCRKRVEENFTKEIMAKNYEKVYKDVIQNKEW